MQTSDDDFYAIFLSDRKPILDAEDGVDDELIEEGVDDVEEDDYADDLAV